MNGKLLLLRDAFLCTTGGVLVIGIFYLIIINVHVLNPFYKAFQDFSYTDMYWSERLSTEKRPVDIVLVNIGHSNRGEIASALDAISNMRPSAIGIDAIFKELLDPKTDTLLRDVIRKTPNLVLASHVNKDRLVQSDDFFLQENTVSGFADLNLNGKDFVIREFSPHQVVDGKNTDAFAVALARTAGKIDSERAGKLDESLPINYIGGNENFLHFDLQEVLNRKNISAMKNAVVIMGYMGTPTLNSNDIEDKHFTPLNSKSAGKSLPDLYGCVIHANIVRMISDQDYITQVPKWANYLLAFTSAYIFVILGMVLHKRNAFLFHFLLKVMELFFSMLLLYFCLMLLQGDVHLRAEPFVVLTVISLELIVFYDYALPYLKRKWRWRSYLSH